MPQASPRVVHLVTQVWGDSFCEAFTRVCLPSLLADGNIPALAARWPCRFVVYTREQDIDRILSEPTMTRLRSVVPVDFHVMDGELQSDKYSAMTDVHHRVLNEAAGQDAAIVWLVPDAVWGHRSLSVVAGALSAGKRAVMQPALRVVKEHALPLLRDRLAAPGFAGFRARELVSIAMRHMHPYYEACRWEAPRFNKNPAITLWSLGPEGVLARAFHLHPLMLYPSRAVTRFSVTFDDDLLVLGCPDIGDFHVVRDSDDAFHIDLTEADWCSFVPLRRRGPSAAFLAWWSLNAANVHHRHFFDQPIRIHADEYSPAWWLVERQSEQVAVRVRRLVRIAAAVRLPFELLFGQRRALFLLRSPESLAPARKAGANRIRRTYDATRRQAFLFACGWVFGYRFACRQLGVTSVYERACMAFYRFQGRVAAMRLRLIHAHSIWLTRKKKIKGAIRRGSGRSVKTVYRQFSLARSRVKHGRKRLRRMHSARRPRQR